MAEHSAGSGQVGIVAMELYYPMLYVEQSELERFDRVSAGKYTVGLGQLQMGVVSDREDVNSMCMTAVRRLFDSYEIDGSLVGRVEVGTETLLDKSKSIKTTLMPLLATCGVGEDVEGVDCLNACYGGTQALFNAVNWLESSSAQGRTALVVMGDVAVYAPGAARCTGGAGAAALLLCAGGEAPLLFEAGTRSLHMRHAYDFYKPRADSEYAVLDGAATLHSYNAALYSCYERYRRKADVAVAAGGDHPGVSTSLCDFAGVLMHSPYSRLVHKAVCRLAYDDHAGGRRTDGVTDADALPIGEYNAKNWPALASDKRVERDALRCFDAAFQRAAAAPLVFSRRVGNMYTPSLYASLGAFVALHNPESPSAPAARLLLFSYGSGSAAAMYALRIADDGGGERLARMRGRMRRRVDALDGRRRVSPEWFTRELLLREQCYGKAPFEPRTPLAELGAVLFPKTYYLVGIDDLFRRSYAFYDGDTA